jgi:chemotaxis protein MotB
MRPDAIAFLKALADVLIELDRHVRVLGHTDNVPIRTAQFPSNWELSAARAVMVVRIFTELHGVPAKYLSATGFGDSRPISENLTPEGRARNRRVEIVVLEKHSHETGDEDMLPIQDETAQTAASQEDSSSAAPVPGRL